MRKGATNLKRFLSVGQRLIACGRPARYGLTMAVSVSYADLLQLMSTLRMLRYQSDLKPHQRFMQFVLANASRSYGQHFQDLWVLFHLEEMRGGYFVEFGGADGVKTSNTYLLEKDYGWTGILAEPARVWQSKIRQHRNCHVDDRCVWSRSGETLDFIEPKMAYHATIERFAGADELAHTRLEGERYTVPTVSLNDLLAHWSAPERIDFLSIDTEGSELEILQAFDFDTWDVRLIAVEHGHNAAKRQGLLDLLTAKGYRRRFDALSDVDDWYVKQA